MNQEVVLGGPNDESCYGGVRLGNNLYFSMGEDQDYLDRPLNSPKVYKAGKGLSLLDSCFIADSLGLSYTVRLNHMDKLTDSTFICLLGDTAKYFAVELDTSLNLINSIPINFGGDTVIGNFECVYPDGDNLLIGGSMGLERPIEYFV